MSKIKNEGALVTNPSKNKKKAKLEKKNLQVAVQKVEDEKENKTTKYVYPVEIKTPEQKKTFRRNARAQRDKFTKQLETLKVSDKKEDKKEYSKIFEEKEKWAGTIYLDPKNAMVS